MKHQPLFRVLTGIVEVICRRHLDELRIFSETINGVETLVVLPHAADYPRLVGRHGGQVNAVTYLVNKAAQRLGERIGFSLSESFVGDREPVEPFAFNPDFAVKAFQQHLEDLAAAVTGREFDYRIEEVGEVIVVTVPCERNLDTETFLSALEAVFKPYCYGSGRKLQFKPQFLNHETDSELLRLG